MVKCQLYSDIHLEFYDGRPAKSRDKLIDQIITSSKGNNAKYLFLAGDIANNKKSLNHFLTRCITEGEWENIFFVPGNHEYYGKVKPLPFGIESYKSVEIDNVYCLHHNRIVLPEMTVCGATLWTHPTNEVYMNMNDRCHIRGAKGKVSLEEIITMHVQDKNYLNNCLDLPDETFDDLTRKPILCMTHHAPGKFLENNISIYSSGYYANCEDLLEKADYWLYGHTHEPVNTVFNDCKIYCNPLGYPNELKEPNFNFTFDV